MHYITLFDKKMSTPTDDWRNDPKVWRASCHQLLDTLKVTERGLLNPNTTKIEEHSAIQSSMMLAGFAFENAFKAWYIARGNKLYINNKRQGLGKHSFTEWIEEYEIETRGWEREALDRVEFFSVAWGRYPSHDQKENERKSEASGFGDINQVRNLISRLLDEI